MDEVTRIPPHNHDAEESILAAAMLDDSALPDIVARLSVEDFYKPSHQKIFYAIVTLNAEDIPVDALSVADRLTTIGTLSDVGGKAKLAEICSNMASTVNWESHCEIIRRNAIARRLIRHCVDVEATAYSNPSDIDSLVASARDGLDNLDCGWFNTSKSVDEVFADLMNELKQGKTDYVSPYLLPEVQIKPGHLVVLAAGTSVGKTAVALDWAYRWAEQKQVVFYEYEMSDQEILQRLISFQTGISVFEMNQGLTGEQYDTVVNSASEIKARKLKTESVYCDIHGLVSKIRNEARAGAEIVFIDYLGLIPFTPPKGQNHAKAVGTQISNRLKRLAMELNIVIVLLSQLNREGQKRDGASPFPRKYDLKDSGEIENDANAIILLWREDTVDPMIRTSVRRSQGLNPLDDSFTLMWMGVEKNRNAPLVSRFCKFEGKSMQIKSLNDGDDSEQDKYQQAEMGIAA